MKWEDGIQWWKIPKDYHHASLELVEKIYPKIAEQGKQWVENPKSSIFICGYTGAGKTYFMFAILRMLISQRPESWCVFSKSDKLDNELLRANEENAEEIALDKYKSAPFLFIDDLGTERTSDRVVKQYCSLIDARLCDFLPTVITSNLNIDQVVERYGDRVASRLGTYKQIKFPDIDLRKKFFSAI